MYYAHSTEDETKKDWQTLKMHLEGTGDLVAEFSKDFCTEAYARNLGLIHDLGKYQIDFQKRIRGDNIEVEHAGCGAMEWLERKYPEAGAYCIAGHHTGLPDCGSEVDVEEQQSTLFAKIKRDVQDYSAFNDELDLHELKEFPAKQSINRISDRWAVEYGFWTRMMYSSLVDADYLDTEKVYNQNVIRGDNVDLTRCLELINDKIHSFTMDTEVKKARNELRKQMLMHTHDESNLYLLNMPTGSGKTLASMQFALERAKLKNKKKIIYVIPFTSIVEQNARVFKEIFGEDSVLEHHCNFDYEKMQDHSVKEKMKRNTENWDASIIVTTNIQFFESIYSNKSRDLRKIHNLANSIIIFDEVHTLPMKFYQPCLDAVKILTTRYNAEGIFMSATLPDYNKWLAEMKCQEMKVVDLINDRENLKVFNRCVIKNLGIITKEQLSYKAQESKSTLIVVNKRRTAKELYEKLSGNRFHLSTYMNHDDREKTIRAVTELLQRGEQVVLVSTSLIEAGVDLDFQVVFRELAGLDNLLQAAGRCNREGKRMNAMTYSFEFDDDVTSYQDEIYQRRVFTREAFELFEDITSKEAIEFYFNRVYTYAKDNMLSMDFANKIRQIQHGKYMGMIGFDFKTYAQEFQLIPDDTKSVIVMNDESRKYVKELQFSHSMEIKRKLQKYSVALREREWNELYYMGVIVNENGVDCLENQSYYNSETGIAMIGNQEEYIF